MTYLGSTNFAFKDKAHELWLVTKKGSVYLTMCHLLYCFQLYTSLPTTQKYLGLPIMCPLCLPDFKSICILWTDFQKHIPASNATKIYPVEAERTDMTKLTGLFCDIFESVWKYFFCVYLVIKYGHKKPDCVTHPRSAQAACWFLGLVDCSVHTDTFRYTFWRKMFRYCGTKCKSRIFRKFHSPEVIAV